MGFGGKVLEDPGVIIPLRPTCSSVISTSARVKMATPAKRRGLNRLAKSACSPLIRSSASARRTSIEYSRLKGQTGRLDSPDVTRKRVAC